MTTNDLYKYDLLQEKARAAFDSGNYVSANTLYADALNFREQAFGEDIISAELTDKIAGIQVRLGHTKEAEDYYKKALAAMERCTYAGHYQLGPILEHLTDFYISDNRWEEAEPVAKRGLDIFEKTLNSEHRSIFEMMYRLVLIYRKLGKHADAETTITKALKNLDSPLGPAEEFKYQQALVYLDQGKTTEATASLQQAITGFEQRRHYTRLVEALGHYAEALKKDNKSAEAKQTQEYLERIKTATRHVRLNSEDIFPATLLRA